MLDEIEDSDIIDMMWDAGDLTWKLDDLQRSITQTVAQNANARRICILSSRQIGKSWWSCVFSASYLQRNHQAIARIIAPTNTQCNDIVRDNLNPIISDAPKSLIAYRASENRWNFANTSSLRLGALERQYVDNNRGGNAELIIYEECGFVKADDFTYGVNSVLGPQLIRKNGLEIFISSPSEDPDHPLHTEIMPECQHLGTLFVFTVFHSPTITDSQIIAAARRTGTVLTLGYVQAVRSLQTITIELIHELAIRHQLTLTEGFRREYLAEILRPSNLMVIPVFKPKTQVFAFDYPFIKSWNVTIDWGGVRDLTVALLHSYSHLQNKDYILAEKVWPANTPTPIIVQELKDSWHQKFKIEAVWADVHGQTSVDLNALSYPVALPQKSDWLASVNAMSSFFSLDNILIHPDCDFLIRSIRGGMFNKTKTDFARSDKLGHCDALAALMYALRSQTRDNIEQDNYLPPRESYVYLPKDPELMSVAKAITNKRFGGFNKR